MMRLMVASAVLGVVGAGTYVLVHDSTDVETVAEVAPYPRTVAPLPVPEVVGRTPWETPLPGESELRRLPDVSPTPKLAPLLPCDDSGSPSVVPAKPGSTVTQIPKFCRIE